MEVLNNLLNYPKLPSFIPSDDDEILKDCIIEDSGINEVGRKDALHKHFFSIRLTATTEQNQRP